MKIYTNFIAKVKDSIISFFATPAHKSPTEIITSSKPAYRLIAIDKNKNNDYEATVQVINKNAIFKMNPDEILANNKITDLFSSRDIRTLTYLGYLSLNNPKYKILAKRLSETNDKMLFAMHKKNNTKIEIRTADEIAQNKDIIRNLTQEDAHMVGYIAGIENVTQEKAQKKKLKINCRNKKSHKNP
jgi:hypothetical protein